MKAQQKCCTKANQSIKPLAKELIETIFQDFDSKPFRMQTVRFQEIEKLKPVVVRRTSNRIQN